MADTEAETVEEREVAKHTAEFISAVESRLGGEEEGTTLAGEVEDCVSEFVALLEDDRFVSLSDGTEAQRKAEVRVAKETSEVCEKERQFVEARQSLVKQAIEKLTDEQVEGVVPKVALCFSGGGYRYVCDSVCMCMLEEYSCVGLVVCCCVCSKCVVYVTQITESSLWGLLTCSCAFWFVQGDDWHGEFSERVQGGGRSGRDHLCCRFVRLHVGHRTLALYGGQSVRGPKGGEGLLGGGPCAQRRHEEFAFQGCGTCGSQVLQRVARQERENVHRCVCVCVCLVCSHIPCISLCVFSSSLLTRGRDGFPCHL
jgi:hypothetical protein